MSKLASDMGENTKVCVRCGKPKDEHFSPWKYPDEFYCSTNTRNMATYLEATPELVKATELLKERSTKPRRNFQLGDSIRNLRRRTGSTQSEFAEKVGIGRSILGAYEEGRAEPSLWTIYKMTQAAGVSMNRFFQIVYSPDQPVEE